jgi:hypothetical protein
MFSLLFTGIAILYIAHTFIMNFNKIMNYDLYRRVSFIMFFIIIIGIHGLLHLGIESVYGFNPLKWF